MSAGARAASLSFMGALISEERAVGNSEAGRTAQSRNVGAHRFNHCFRKRALIYRFGKQPARLFQFRQTAEKVCAGLPCILIPGSVVILFCFLPFFPGGILIPGFDPVGIIPREDEFKGFFFSWLEHMGDSHRTHAQIFMRPKPAFHGIGCVFHTQTAVL